MNKNSSEKEIIAYIKAELKLDEATIRQVGIGPLLAQIASQKGMEGVTKCDADSGDTGQYVGDLLTDISRGEKEG